jgi:hypothetical protein
MDERCLAKRGDEHPHRSNGAWLARALKGNLVHLSLPIGGGTSEVESDGWF